MRNAKYGRLYGSFPCVLSLSPQTGNLFSMKASLLPLALSGAISVAVVSMSFAGAPSPRAEAIEESEGYTWSIQGGGKMEAIRLQGNKVSGEESYAVCIACHLPNGAGRPDGAYPQLAGQHATVLIKQMVDIRTGFRDNLTMYPFAVVMSDAQGLADVSAYIGSLCIPTENGKYEGADAAAQIVKGRNLYEQQCLKCHGKNGEGNAEKFYPVIAGQHYKYLLRQMTDIRDDRRRNSDPDMVRIIKPYTDDMLVAISAYQASLAMPGAMCKEKNKTVK
jgi:cytochrome c553